MDDSSLCFINCHLAAGQRHRRQRNNDLIDILEKPALPDITPPASEAYAGGGNGAMIFDHEYVFLNGDLNYRIDLPREVVCQHIAQKNFGPLLEQDQLLKEMRFNQGFRLRSFREAPLSFAPTYKFDS
jgi:hypothetical protein